MMLGLSIFIMIFISTVLIDVLIYEEFPIKLVGLVFLIPILIQSTAIICWYFRGVI